MMGEHEELGIITHCVIDILDLIHQRTNREFLILDLFADVLKLGDALY